MDVYELIDALVESKHYPTRYTTRDNLRNCVACVLRQEDLFALDDFPGVHWDRSGTARIAYWPDHPWTPGIDEYLDIIFDPSGEESEGGFTD